MFSVEESKVYFKGLGLSDKQVEDLRNATYSQVNDILDELYEAETNN